MRWYIRKALCELQIMCSTISSTDISVVVLVLGKKGAQFYEVESKFVVFVLKGDLSDRPLWEFCPEAV